MTDPSISTLAPFAAIRTARPTRVRFVVLALLAVGTKNSVLQDARARAAALPADVGRVPRPFRRRPVVYLHPRGCQADGSGLIRA